MSARWTVELLYASAGALRTDVETQLVLGGLMLDTQSPEGFPADGAIRLRFIAPELAAVELDATVAERTDSSLCFEVEEGTLGPLRKAIEGAVRAAADIPLVSFHDGGVAPESRPPPVQELTLDKKIAVMSIGEKIQLALHGPREARTFLARERAGSIQMALVRNPKMTIDEVTALARGAVLAPDAADAMAKDPKLGSSQQVLSALVRNPRTPIPVAVELVGRLHPTELRVLAKGTNVRGPVAAAARKKLNVE